MQHAPTDQHLGVFRKKFGDIVVTALLDAELKAHYGVLKGLDEDTMRQEMRAAFREEPLVITVSCFIVHTGGKVVMIDAGTGPNEMFDGGRLPQALNSAGVSPDSVDTILVSHLHGDHVGGLATREGTAFFPNAELLVHEEEVKFWLENSNPPAEMQAFFDSAKQAVAPYRDRMRTFTSGTVAPGIDAEPFPGHTPGHTGFFIGSGADGMLMWTDIVHVLPLQATHPELSIVFDADPEQAKLQRKRVFERAASDRLLVAGSHMDFPPFAHVERHGSGYRFIPDRWLPTL